MACERGDHGAPHQVRSVAHSACQAPSARSSTARLRRGAASRRARVRQRGPADQHRQDRVGLLRHRRRARRQRPPTSSPISGRLRVSTSLAIRPQASVQRDRGVAQAGDAGPGGVPRRRRSEAEAIGQDDGEVGDDRYPRGCRQLDGRGHGAGRPAELHREDQPPRSSYASRTPVSHCAALSPNVVGTACWVSVRATIGVSRWLSARRRAPACARSLEASGPTASRAPSMSAVSTTSWLVRPRCSHAAAAGCVLERAAQSRPAASPGCRRPRSPRPATPRGSPRRRSRTSCCSG